jgi:23S rRNA pseudoU1915 N3-methylase RlmH
MSVVKTLDVESKEVKSISKEELATLQESVNKQNQIQMQIGGLEGHKAVLLESLKEAAEALSGVQKTLEDVYGAINIDLTTGEISDAPEAN